MTFYCKIVFIETKLFYFIYYIWCLRFSHTSYRNFFNVYWSVNLQSSRANRLRRLTILHSATRLQLPLVYNMYTNHWEARYRNMSMEYPEVGIAFRLMRHSAKKNQTILWNQRTTLIPCELEIMQRYLLQWCTQFIYRYISCIEQITDSNHF